MAEDPIRPPHDATSPGAGLRSMVSPPARCSANMSGSVVSLCRCVRVVSTISCVCITSAGRCSRRTLREPRSGRRPTSPLAASEHPQAHPLRSASPVSGSSRKTASTRTGCGTMIPPSGGTSRPIRWDWSMRRVSMDMRGRIRGGGLIREGNLFLSWLV